MLYLRICFDKPDSGKLRERNLKQHREYVASYLGAKDGTKVVQGGPMCSGDQLDDSIGSFLVIEASSLQEVQRFHNDDPFTRADLFARTDVVRWDRHIGNPAQGDYIP